MLREELCLTNWHWLLEHSEQKCMGGWVGEEEEKEKMIRNSLKDRTF